jgi:threonine/homoserine/homoserine lactone efflux protein
VARRRAAAYAYPGGVTTFLIALVPTIGVLLLFWIGIRALLQADRRERAAQARIEAAERLRNVRTEPSEAAGASVADSGGGAASDAAGSDRT